VGCRTRVGFPGPAGCRAGLSLRGEVTLLPGADHHEIYSVRRPAPIADWI